MLSRTWFWDRIAKMYAKQPIADEAAYERKLAVTRTYFRPDTAVLEFGCGTGSTALLHAPHVGHIRALDFSPKMIAIAEGKRLDAGIGNVTFELAAIDEIALPQDAYDAVLALSILHLLADKEAVIAKVFETLKPGGVFVSSTVVMGESRSIFKIIGPIGHALGVLPLVRVFTGDALEASLRAAGFDIDHRWQPGPGKSVFIVAKKPG